MRIEVGRFGSSVLFRVLGVVVLAGVVALGLATVSAVHIVRDEMEARLVQEAVDRTGAMRDALDHQVALSRSELRAVGLAVACGRPLEVPSLVSGTVAAVRCLDGPDEVFDAAADERARALLRAAPLPEEGRVAMADEHSAVLSWRSGSLSVHGLLDLSSVLRPPPGWTVELGESPAGAGLGPAADGSGAVALVGGVLARREPGEDGAEQVRASAGTADGLTLAVRAPLAPAQAAAFAVIRKILVWSALALLPLLGLGWLLARAVTSPIRALARAVREAGSGPVTLPALPRDEIGDLGVAVRGMSERLTEDARALRSAVEFHRSLGALGRRAEVLTNLEEALRAGLPGHRWVVLSSEAIEEGRAAAALGGSEPALRVALSGDAAERLAVGPAAVGARSASDLSGRWSVPTLTVRSLRVEGRLVLALPRAEGVHGVVLGPAEPDERVSRHAELLANAAAAALWRLELFESVLANEKLAVLGRMSVTVNHEIRNPLAFILANLRAVEPELEGEPLEAVLEAREGAERIERLLGDLTPLSAGGLAISAVETDLARVVRRAVHVARAATPGAVVEVEAEGQIPVRGDPERLEQVVQNLVRNAVEAARTRDAGRVLVVAGVEGERAVVDVSDNGPGVPPAVRARLFEAFATSKGARGTGLGLFMSRSLARAHGGELELRSSGPDGSTFRLVLPLGTGGEEPEALPDIAEAAPVTRSVGRGAGRCPGRRPAVLVVDDEVAIVRALTRWLGQWADVSGTTDPRRGLALAIEGEFSLILCDLNMREMDGRAFVQALEARRPEAAAKVVIMTGSARLDVPGVRVLSKPLDPEAIRELLDES